MQGKDEIRNAIMLSADKHPNSRVSKLIRNVEAVRSQKNIVLLLIELAEHAEYAQDFSISLKYYLDLFDHLGVGHEIVLNETGLLLLNSSKIYGRRVDYVHELVERQIITLSKADKEIDGTKNVQQSNVASEKPKRGRKRLVEAPKDPHEIELIPKKFRKITQEKRFAINASNNTSANNIKSLTTTMRQNEAEQYIHPAGWKHANIVDFENEEEIDSKRNYKLFTHHVEHRYNTLVTDINFRLHFMVKDFIDAEEERMEEEDFQGESTIWPPLSEAYVEQYLNLENRIFHQSKEKPLPRKRTLEIQTQKNAENDSRECALSLNAAEHLANPIQSIVEPANLAAKINSEQTLNNTGTDDVSVTLQNDSALGESITDSFLEGSVINSSVENENISNLSLSEGITDSILEESKIEQNGVVEGENAKEADSVQNDLEVIETADRMTKNGNESNLEISTNNANESQQNISELEKSLLYSTNINDETDIACKENENLTVNSSVQNDPINSTKDSTILSDQANATFQENKSLTLNSSVQNDSELNDSTIVQANNCSEGYFSQESFSVFEDSYVDDSKINLKVPEIDKMEHDDTQIKLDGLILHLDDDGFVSDLDEQVQRMLSPTVPVLDVFPNLPNKKNFRIIVDEDIRALLNISDDEETYELPVTNRPESPPVRLNIMKFDEKYLKKRVLFKLGDEYDLYKQSRKRARKAAERKEYREAKQIKLYNMSDNDVNGVHGSPANSFDQTSYSELNDFSDTDDDTPFLGFDENGDRFIESPSHRLSRDSGVGVDGPIISERSNEIILEETSQDADTTEDCSNNLTEKENQTSNRGEESFNENDEINNYSETHSSPKESEKQIEVEIYNAIEQNELKNISIEVTSTNVEENINNSEITIPVAQCESVELSAEIPCSQIFENIEEEPSDDVDDNTVQSDDELDSSVVSHSMHKEVNISADLDINSNKTKIQKWHEHLQPILAKSRERHHFDVFQIGTEIINKFEERNSSNCNSAMGKSISFHDVMENKDASYVSRYFLSSLLLANQSNIKIAVNNKSSEQPSAWNDIKFELLSTKRHTVSIEDNIGMVTNSLKSNIPQAKTSHPVTSTKSRTKVTNNRELLTVPSTITAPTVAMSNVAESPIVKVNLDVVKPFKQIEKLPRNGDDYDSGIFSNEESLT